jgi:hypothetical protein
VELADTTDLKSVDSNIVQEQSLSPPPNAELLELVYRVVPKTTVFKTYRSKADTPHQQSSIFYSFLINPEHDLKLLNYHIIKAMSIY